jgi:hypothetical protein
VVGAETFVDGELSQPGRLRPTERRPPGFIDSEGPESHPLPSLLTGTSLKAEIRDVIPRAVQTAGLEVETFPWHFLA